MTSTTKKTTKSEVKSTSKTDSTNNAKAKRFTIKPIENVSTEAKSKNDANPSSEKQSRKNNLKKRPDMVITPEMNTLIDRAKMLVTGGQTKAAVAREVYDKLNKLERRQIVHVFIKGCGLTKAGAGTYYQNLTKPVKK